MRTLILFLYVIILLNSAISTPTIQQKREEAYIYTSETTYTNKGIHNITLTEDLRSLNFFPNSSWQSTYLLSVSQPYNITTDNDRNRIVLLNIPPIPPGGNITTSYSMKVIRRERPIPNITFQDSLDLSSIPNELNEYYRAEGSWLVEDEALKSLAQEIFSKTNSSNILTIVTAISDWIGNNIKTISHETPLYPNETYIFREGDCDDQANLLITLCRILKIPAYLQVGCIVSLGAEKESTYWDGHVTSVLKNLAYHAWALIYIPPWGWLPFDMTLGWLKSDPLSVIKSAPVWKKDVIVMFDIVRLDWAGLGRSEREYITSHPIYIYSMNYLRTRHSEIEHVFLERPEFWISVSLFILLAGGYLAKRKYFKPRP